MTDKQNGFHFPECPIAKQWDRFREKQDSIGEGIERIAINNEVAARHSAELPAIRAQLETMNKHLIAAATGRKQLPLSLGLAMILIIAVLILKDSGTDLKLNREGFQIDNRH